MRTGDDDVTLLEVVEIQPAPPPPPPSLLRPHVEPAPVDGAGSLVCIRLNCDRQGLPTDDSRCGRCGHRTQLAEMNRWPRHLTY